VSSRSTRPLASTGESPMPPSLPASFPQRNEPLSSTLRHLTYWALRQVSLRSRRQLEWNRWDKKARLFTAGPFLAEMKCHA
jgi:hypothetical protein